MWTYKKRSVSFQHVSKRFCPLTILPIPFHSTLHSSFESATPFQMHSIPHHPLYPFFLLQSEIEHIVVPYGKNKSFARDFQSIDNSHVWLMSRLHDNREFKSWNYDVRYRSFAIRPDRRRLCALRKHWRRDVSTSHSQLPPPSVLLAPCRLQHRNDRLPFRFGFLKSTK